MSSPKTQNPKRKFETEASSSTLSYAAFKTHQLVKTETRACLDTMLSQIDELRDEESELRGQLQFWEENQKRVGTAAFLAKRDENFAAVSLEFDKRFDELTMKVIDGVDVSEESLLLLDKCMREILEFPQNRGEIAEQNTCALTIALEENFDEQEFHGPRVIRMIHKVSEIAAGEDSLLLRLQEQVRAEYKVLVQEQVRADVASATDTPAISSPKSYFKTLLKETTKGWATLNDLMKEDELLRRRAAEKQGRLKIVQEELAELASWFPRDDADLKRMQNRRSELRSEHSVKPSVDLSRKCLSLVQQCLNVDSDYLQKVKRESTMKGLEVFLDEIYEEQLELGLKLTHQIAEVRGLLRKEGLLLNRLEQQVRKEHTDRGVFLSGRQEQKAHN